MTITNQTGRQEVVSANVTFEYEDMTSGTAFNAIQLPAGATLIDGTYFVETAFDSGTSDAVVVAFNSLTLLTDADAQAAVRTPFTMPTTSNPNNVTVSSPTWITATWTAVGTAATAGKIRIEARYVVDGRACFAQG